MHEMSVCLSLLDMIGRIAEDNGARSVAGVTVAVGPLSGVEAGLLARAFEVARRGTVAESAAINVELTPVGIRCEECDVRSIAPVNTLLCSRCGSERTIIESGNELLLKSVELEMPEAAE